MEEKSMERAALYRKLNAFRADVIQCDWKDDKMVSLGGTKGYPYLSADKIIKNLAPLMVKHGIEMEVEYSELTNQERNGGYHWTVRATVVLIDVETGYSTSSCAYGEGQDTQDKGIAKAQTAAFKKCLSARNLIADGIDPDAVDSWEPTKFYKKMAEEQEEVKSKVLKQSVPVPEVKEEPKTEPIPVAPAPKKEEPKEGPKEEVVQTRIEETPVKKYIPTGPQKGAIDKIVAAFDEKRVNGTISVEDYNQMSMDCATMTCAADAVAFIKKYRVM